MIYLFTPYYNKDTPEFKKSLGSQTVKFLRIKRDRKRDGIYWTKALNDFHKEMFRWRGVKKEDIICIMNNDIQFNKDLFLEGSQVKEGEVYAPEFITIYWKDKKFRTVLHGQSNIHTFPGRCFFMTFKDFANSGGFCRLLPHYLSDYDFGIKMIKRLKPVTMKNKIIHPYHKKVSGFKMHSFNNPVFWTIFLLRHPNRYTLLNILKAWIR